jgi:hypothetical protein
MELTNETSQHETTENEGEESEMTAVRVPSSEHWTGEASTDDGRDETGPTRSRQRTPATTWSALAESPIDDLLDWPPVVYTLTETILERSEAYRFALSSPGAKWPPADVALDSDDGAAYQARGSSSVPGRLDAWVTSP